MSKPTDDAVARFHELYYDSPERTWQNTYWLGVRAAKCPLDLWVYQEILHETRPDLVIESGTAWGGSALFLASVCDQIGQGSVCTIDIAGDPNRPSHPRIEYVLGSSTDGEVVARVTKRVRSARRVMVILDSDHSCEHVTAELQLYAPFVTSGCYLIVEDTNVNGHPVLPDFGPGPMEAIADFLAGDERFRVDADREKLLMTFNPGGYLRRT